MNFNDLRIQSIHKETQDTVVVNFDIPDALAEQYTFLPGQYVTIEQEINGESLRRSYSICSAPYDDGLSVGVKRVSEGRMSNHIHDKFKVGNAINVSTPEGNFVVKIDEDANRDHYFIGAGSGITPIMSMIKTILENEPMSRCYLLYGSRHEDQIIFKNDLDKLQKKYTGQLHTIHCLSQPPTQESKKLFGLMKKTTVLWDGLTGRIGRSQLLDFLEKYPKEGNESHYYLCGPGNLIQVAEETLKAIDVDNNRIHREYFGVTGELGTAPTIEGIASSVTVTLNDETFTYQSDGKEPILDELMKLKKNPPYSCTSGACSSCVAKVTKGKAEMEVCYALDDEDVADGYILTCQAKATSKEIELIFE